MPLPIAAAGAFGWPQLLFLLLVAAIAVLAPVLTRRARRMREEEVRRPRARPAEADAAAEVRRAADKAQVDLLETGREIGAQLDTKIRVLNTLVKDADRLVRRLDALREETPARTGDEDTRPEEAVRGETPPAPDDEDDAPAATEETVALFRPAPGEPAARTPSGRRRTDLHDRIASLRREGRDEAQIARVTRLSLPEVRLALRLLAEEESGAELSGGDEGRRREEAERAASTRKDRT